MCIRDSCKEQAHLIALVTDRGIIRQHIKDDHVAYFRVEAFQRHDVVPLQFLRAGFLPGLGNFFSNRPGRVGQTVIPVSYTHLDVYKRQVILRGGI